MCEYFLLYNSSVMMCKSDSTIVQLRLWPIFGDKWWHIIRKWPFSIVTQILSPHSLWKANISLKYICYFEYREKMPGKTDDVSLDV